MEVSILTAYLESKHKGFEWDGNTEMTIIKKQVTTTKTIQQDIQYVLKGTKNGADTILKIKNLDLIDWLYRQQVDMENRLTSRINKIPLNGNPQYQ